MAEATHKGVQVADKLASEETSQEEIPGLHLELAKQKWVVKRAVVALQPLCEGGADYAAYSKWEPDLEGITTKVRDIREKRGVRKQPEEPEAVSYTHLTLPTILLV